MLIVKYSTCRIFYAWITISAQLLSDSFPYNAYVAHIQNNALLYFCNIIHVHHCLCLQGRHRIFMQINISLNKFTFTKFLFHFNLIIQQVDFCELLSCWFLAIIKYEKTGFFVELHNKSSHKTGEMPMAALKGQPNHASLLFLMCFGYTAMSHHTSPGSLHTLTSISFLWVWPLHPCSVWLYLKTPALFKH